MLPEPPPRALKLNIDADALAANWRALDALSGNAAAAAAVKADAYGVGAKRVVPILRDAGCRDFLVAHFSEVADLHGLVDPERISVLHGPLNADDVRYAKALGIKPVINSPRQARLWSEGGGGRCDVMVDTGMNRLGFAMADLADEAVCPLDVDVLMSHLASSEEDNPFNEVQRQRWLLAGQALRHRRASLANSAGIALGKAYHGDMTRPGLSLYGGIQRTELEGGIRQVVTPMAALLQTRTIETGEGAGYNSTFIADRQMRIGTIAIGYADGYLRCWSGKGEFVASGKKLPVLGRVSMDMTILDLTDAPELREGDWVRADYSLPRSSAGSGLSQYELLTLLGKRFGRN